MKRILSLLIVLSMLMLSVTALAEEVYIELYELEHEQYMFEETLVVSGDTNAFVTLALYYPEDFVSQAKFVMNYSPDELNEGIEIQLGAKAVDWPEGVWTIIVQNGDVSESLEFTLCEVREEVEEPEDDPDDGPSRKPSGNTSVTAIIPEKTEITLEEGQSEKVNVTTSATALSVEIDDEAIIDASITNKVLTITALKCGESQLWVKTGSNYASMKVTVVPKTITETPPDKPEEENTEEPFVNSFEDITSHWAEESILTLYKKGVINGMDEKTFAPDAYVTRAQFVTMLEKAFDLKSTLTSSPLKDVKESDWYYKAVLAAYETGITKGDEGNNFNPSSLITRQDMAVMAFRTISDKVDVSADTALFSDDSAISEYAKEAVYTMKALKVINGVTEVTFEPLGKATRAQAAHIIAALMEL